MLNECISINVGVVSSSNKKIDIQQNCLMIHTFNNLKVLLWASKVLALG